MSIYQSNILKLMKNNEFVLVTNEGKSYKCWLEDAKGNIIKNIDKRTVRILFNDNKIRMIEDKKILSNKLSCNFYYELNK